MRSVTKIFKRRGERGWEGKREREKINCGDKKK